MCPEGGCDKDKSPVWALISDDALAHWPGGPDGEGAGPWSGEVEAHLEGRLDEAVCRQKPETQWWCLDLVDSALLTPRPCPTLGHHSPSDMGGSEEESLRGEGTDGVRSRSRHRVQLQEMFGDCGWESGLPSLMTEVCGKPHRLWQQQQQQNPTQTPERLTWRAFILLITQSSMMKLSR